MRVHYTFLLHLIIWIRNPSCQSIIKIICELHLFFYCHWWYINIKRYSLYGVMSTFILSTDQSAMSLPILEVLKPNIHRELLSDWSMMSCVWLGGQRWMKGQLTWSIRHVVRCLCIAKNRLMVFNATFNNISAISWRFAKYNNKRYHTHLILIWLSYLYNTYHLKYYKTWRWIISED